jgi:hypothetical protein
MFVFETVKIRKWCDVTRDSSTLLRPRESHLFSPNISTHCLPQMAPRGWAALSSRKAWLDVKREGYVLARATNTIDGWYTKVFHEYFATYHWSLQDHEEPDPSRTYSEPASADTDAAAFKTDKVNARKDVCLGFLFISFFMLSHPSS